MIATNSQNTIMQLQAFCVTDKAFMDFKKASTIDKTLKNYNRFLDEHNALKEK